MDVVNLDPPEILGSNALKEDFKSIHTRRLEEPQQCLNVHLLNPPSLGRSGRASIASDRGSAVVIPWHGRNISQSPDDLGYDGPSEEKRPDSVALLEKPLSLEDQRTLLLEFIKTADPAAVAAHYALLSKRASEDQGPQEGSAAPSASSVSNPDAASAPTPLTIPLLPDGRPRLWAERTTGREVSPADFIRQHYGQTREDGTWDPMGLTRAHLSHDRALIAAYDRSVERHPDRALPGLEPERKVYLDDPEAAISRHRQLQREATARYRQRVSLSNLTK